MFKTFTPAKSFNRTWLLLLLLTVFFVQCKKDDGDDDSNTHPTVLSVAPLDSAISVITSQKLTATFSRPMDTATINATSFLLKAGTTAVPGLVTYTDSTATFTPASYLASSTLYIATITTTAADTAGHTLQTNYVWSFTTGTTASPDVPRVIITDPAANASNVAFNKKVSATFSEAMNPSSITAATFTLKQGNTVVAGTLGYSGTTAVFTPTSNLAANSTYTATITTGAQDVSGTALSGNYTWSFNTGALADAVPPTVLSTSPLNAAQNVALNKVVSATFSESMDPLTLTNATYTVSNGGNTLPGTVSYSGNRAEFRANSNFTAGETYTAKITTAAKDLAGNALANEYSWTFTTGTTTNQPTVNLGSASNFVVLSGSGITNAGLTVINGDIGTSPTGTINGFPPGVVNGNIHAANSIAAQGKQDLTTAFNEVQGRATGAISLPGDLSGLTLTPGLYSNSTSVMLSAGNVTLDAQGDINAVFIFQMGSTLTTMPGTQVILSGGAQANNIYWSVGTSATLGTNSIFYGNILADQSISLNTGAVLKGRALTRIAAVTLQFNTINKP